MFNDCASDEEEFASVFLHLAAMANDSAALLAYIYRPERRGLKRLRVRGYEGARKGCPVFRVHRPRERVILIRNIVLPRKEERRRHDFTYCSPRSRGILGGQVFATIPQKECLCSRIINKPKKSVRRQ
jgi:hypothetical protein